MITTNNCTKPNFFNQPTNRTPANIQAFCYLGFVSITENQRESHEQIRQKIFDQFLLEHYYLQKLEHSLQTWINEAKGTDEYSDRVSAADKIRTCYHNQSSTLDLSYHPITSLPDLPTHPKLIYLNLSYTRITSLDGIAELKALTYLHLRGTRITSLDGIPELRSLTDLDLSSTQIASLEGMPKLENLSYFSLQATPLTSIQGIPELRSLTVLDLSSTQITSLQGIPNLPALTELYLHQTPITSLAGISELPTLTHLYLSQTQIASFDGIPELRSLTFLNLSRSRITNLSGVVFPTRLRLLYLEGCLITSFADCSFDSGVVRDIPEARLIELGATIRRRREAPTIGPSLLTELENLFPSTEISSVYTNLLSHSDAPALANFLRRMRESWSIYQADLRSYLNLANENHEFREVLFLEIQTTETNCDDRPLYFFGRLSVIASYYQAKQEDLPDNMLRALLAMHSIKLIQQRSLALFDGEELEAALLLILKLKSRLSLPTCLTSMGCEYYAQSLLNRAPNIEDEV
jgi:hypothetical protein